MPTFAYISTLPCFLFLFPIFLCLRFPLLVPPNLHFPLFPLSKPPVYTFPFSQATNFLFSSSQPPFSFFRIPKSPLYHFLHLHIFILSLLLYLDFILSIHSCLHFTLLHFGQASIFLFSPSSLPLLLSLLPCLFSSFPYLHVSLSLFHSFKSPFYIFVLPWPFYCSSHV